VERSYLHGLCIQNHPPTYHLQREQSGL
jgi:hypothetical protein